ncbi:unnamed protein product [Phytophthora lilii]|uniref:Trafficking protein particle complex subunit 2-like protein n=1 Tax=Phytophthora lilii TaxID=2077276 RepID=A0A9W7D831_9STRA|nr:unnamed protein product [Phytophthora lilii]
MASSPTAIAGKLKVSSLPLATNGTAATMKKTKLDPLNLPEVESPEINLSANFPATSNASRMYSSQSATGQVRVVPLTKYERREGFVTKTRRRALEAEYYKQVRLAQLEVECELEENLHIRAAREAKKLQAVGQFEKQTDLGSNSVRSASDATGNDPTELVSTNQIKEAKPNGCWEDTTQSDAKPAASQQVPENEYQDAGATIATSSQPVETVATAEIAAQSNELANESVTTNSESANGSEIGATGGQAHQQDVVEIEESARNHPKQNTYEDNEFDGDDNDVKDNSKEAGFGGSGNAWNVDPNPQHNSLSEEAQNNRTDLDRLADIKFDDDDDDVKYSNSGNVWNVEPNPQNKEQNTGVQDNRTDLDQSAENEFDDDDDVEKDRSKGAGADSSGEIVREVWNADPNPQRNEPNEGMQSGHTGLDRGNDSSKEADSDGSDNVILVHNVWNEDANPQNEPNEGVRKDCTEFHLPAKNEFYGSSNDVKGTSKGSGSDGSGNVWNLNPNPHNSDPNEEVQNDGSDVDEPASSNNVEDDSTRAAVWNLDSNQLASPTLPAEPATQDKSDADSVTWNADPHTTRSDTTVDHDSTGNSENGVDKPSIVHELNDLVPSEDNDASNVWNVDPNDSVATTTQQVAALNSSSTEVYDEPIQQQDDLISSEDNNTGNVWNVDPNYAEAPTEGCDEPESAQEEAQAGVKISDSLYASPPNVTETANAATDHTEVSESGTSSLTPAFDNAAESGGDMTEAPPEHTSEVASSPRESEASSPLDDGTPEYTPPSSPRDSEATGDEEDTTCPLYIRTFGEEGEDLGFHYIAHVSLDVIEEKLRGAGLTSSKDDMYLGFLGPVEDYRVYGYVTNTSVKFVVVLQDAPVRESELRPVSCASRRLWSQSVD